MFGDFPDDLLEQFKRDYAERQAMALGYPMPNFADKSEMACNKPRAEAHGGKSHVVKACEGGKEKLIRFGARGVEGSPKKEGESEAYRKRRESFKARHAKNIARGKMSAAYWADRVKW
jgi:predicted PolB exonuclease-like 3'-5' exonuclease